MFQHEIVKLFEIGNFGMAKFFKILWWCFNPPMGMDSSAD